MQKLTACAQRLRAPESCRSIRTGTIHSVKDRMVQQCRRAMGLALLAAYLVFLAVGISTAGSFLGNRPSRSQTLRSVQFLGGSVLAIVLVTDMPSPKNPLSALTGCSHAWFVRKSQGCLDEFVLLLQRPWILMRHWDSYFQLDQELGPAVVWDPAGADKLNFSFSCSAG